MRGYRAEEWGEPDIKKCLKLPVRMDFCFQLTQTPPPALETVVAASLPVFCSDASRPGPDHKDKLSSVMGACKRLGAEVSPCPFKKMKKILTYARRHIHPQFNTIAPEDIPSAEEWINGVNHPERRKNELREALKILREHGMQPRPGFDDEDPRTCKSFIKDEKYDECKPSRWINSSLDIIKVAFGPIADACMGELVKNPSMIKTVPVSERAKAIWNAMGGVDVIAQSSDATAMEDHYANIFDPNSPTGSTNDPRYRIANEFMIYLCGGRLVTENQMKAVHFLFFRTPGVPLSTLREYWVDIRDSVYLADFCTNILNTYRKLKMRNFGYVLVNAILCSGEMDTSLRNSYTMYVMVNYAIYKNSNGRITHTLTFNEGDDSLAVYPEGLQPDEQFWTDHGWVVKIEFRGLVNEASFCGLVFDPIDLVSVPDIRKVLAGFGWTNRRYVRASDRMLMQLLRCKALSMACEYGQVPIIGALAHRLLYLTRKVTIRKTILEQMDQYDRERFQINMRARVWEEKPDPPYRTRLLVERLQNIPIHLQVEVEEKLSTINLAPFSLASLDFPLAYQHNMSRCRETLNTPRFFDFDGRHRVCTALRQALAANRSPQKASMMRCIDLLDAGRI